LGRDIWKKIIFFGRGALNDEEKAGTGPREEGLQGGRKCTRGSDKTRKPGEEKKGVLSL